MTVIVKKLRVWAGPEGKEHPDAPLYEAGCLMREAANEIERLRAVLDATHKLVTEGALIGFIPTEGTWAERLYANQANLHDALNR